jgi:hypothetical protein
MLTWAWDQAPVDNPSDLLVLLALADEANELGGDCFPSLRRVAKRARLSVGAVHKAIARLEADGLIEVKRPAKPAPGQANHYQILTDGRRNRSPQSEQLGHAEQPETVHLVNGQPENCSRPFTPERTELFTTVHPGVNVPTNPSTDPGAAAPKSSFLPGSGNVTPIDRSQRPPDRDPDTPTRIADARARLRGALG